MKIKEIRQLTGLSQPKFCERYSIPLPTLRKWEQGHRTCPDYVAELLEFKVREDLKMSGFSKEDLKHSYHTGFAEGVKIHSENIANSVKQEIENGTIKIEYGKDRLFSIINSVIESQK